MVSLYTLRSFYTEKVLHTEKLLHTASFYTQNVLCETAGFYRKKIHREAFLYIMTIGIAAPKPDGSRRQRKKHDFEALFKKEFYKENH